MRESGLKRKVNILKSKTEGVKRKDLLFIIIYVGIFLPIIFSSKAYSIYAEFSIEWAFTASFLKFAILATMGEMVGMRIRTGNYYSRNFGLIPRMIVWGFLGMFTKAAFMIFGGGVPSIALHAGMQDPSSVMSGALTGQKIFLAFLISSFLNVIYAPVLMVTHKVTDSHILATGGTLGGFFSTFSISKTLSDIDWNTMWGFVLKKTIPFFWIPAHTITFLLPPELQILFAAILSTALGLILAFAARGKISDNSEN
jgi:hypothetical protein